LMAGSVKVMLRIKISNKQCRIRKWQRRFFKLGKKLSQWKIQNIVLKKKMQIIF
jgi:hypothetical protein